MIIANTAATATTTYSHTCRGVVGRGSVELSRTIFDVGDVGGLLVSGEVEGGVTSPVVTSPVVTVGGGVGRGLEFRLGCDVSSVWVVDVISSMGVGVTEGEGSTVIGTLAHRVGSVWKNTIESQSGPGLFCSPSSTKEVLLLVCDILPLILNRQW